VGIVRVLLRDPRVDPTACESKAVKAAAWNNHEEVVRVLLEDARVASSVGKRNALVCAATCGLLQQVKRLLGDSALSIDARTGRQALQSAAANKHAATVYVLCSDWRFVEHAKNIGGGIDGDGLMHTSVAAVLRNQLRWCARGPWLRSAAGFKVY
jgi:hypothetical protein